MNFTLISAVFFLIISLLHLARLIFGVQITMNEHVIPVWLSLFGFLVPLFLSIMLFKEGKARKK